MVVTTGELSRLAARGNLIRGCWTAPITNELPPPAVLSEDNPGP